MAPFRGRGRGGFQGRGRGRGGARGGKKNGFTSARVQDEIAEINERHATPEEPEEQSDTSDAPSSEDEALPVSNAYHTLLRSLSANPQKGEEPQRKRRKLDRDSSYHRRHDDEGKQPSVDAQESSDAELVTAQADEEDEEEEHVVDPEEGLEQLQNNSGSFQQHFERPDENELAERIKAISDNQWQSKKMDSHGKCILQIPGTSEEGVKRRQIKSTRDVRLKQRLVETAEKALGAFDGVEQDIAPSIFDYQDVLFGARTVQNAGRIRDMCCLHALNHILNTRDRVLKNNAKLSAATADDDVEYRDQGFTRPKILFLLETKQACVRVIDSLTKLHEFEQQENRKRFLDNFSLPEDKFSKDKPDDFRELFEGNDENEFRIGVKLTRKTLKFYSTFYNSDIIFASTLGLRRAIESSKDKKKDYDFLSSIEIVVMEQADATLMQNWEHAEYVFEHLNLQPKDAHGCDFSRVRSWYLDGHAVHIRQIIVLSAYLAPKINTLYNKHMRNFSGRLKYTPGYATGVIETLPLGIKQTFARFDSPSYLTDPDARFKFFSSTVLPQIARLPKPPEGGVGVLLFIPSYLDFVRVRNSLVDSDLSFASISEYTDVTNVRKARSHFMSGRHSLLLYTGRAHHFHRYNIRGVKRVVFYGVPENPRFYAEVVGFVEKSVERGEIGRAETGIKVCFSRWEALELERVVGAKRVGRMVKDKGDVFDFV